MFSVLFWKDFSERAFFTALEALLGIVSASGFTAASFDWGFTLITMGVAVLAVLVKSLAALPINSTISPASVAKDERGI